MKVEWWFQNICKWNEVRSWQKWGRIGTSLTFWGSRPVLDNLDFVWGHGEAFWGQHVSKIFAGSGMEFTFSAWATSQLVQSLQSTPKCGLCAQKCCRSRWGCHSKKYMMNMTSIMSAKTSIHKSLKHGRCIGKSFRALPTTQRTVMGLECSFPFVSR